MSQAPFRKFIKAKKGSVLKEEIRKEKKLARKEKQAYFEKKKAEKIAKQVAGLKPRPVPIGNPSPASAPAKPQAAGSKTTPASKSTGASVATGPMPLNKYLAHCGVSSRREAAELVSKGKVKVNNKIITEPGYKVKPGEIGRAHV